MKKTLVIHPADPTTDFLKIIYQDRNFTEETKNFEPNNLKYMIQEHDRIVMLGHGYHHGLLNYMQPIIDKSFVPYLKNKELVGIWCFAKSFFDHHGLTGFHTNMFISEPLEAQMMGVIDNNESIELSNLTFAKAVRSNLFHADCLQRVKSTYEKLNCPVSKYNGQRLHFRNHDDPTIRCTSPDLNNYLMNIGSLGSLLPKK